MLINVKRKRNEQTEQAELLMRSLGKAEADTEAETAETAETDFHERQETSTDTRNFHDARHLREP
jgi:hypothetical protein